MDYSAASLIVCNAERRKTGKSSDLKKHFQVYLVDQSTSKFWMVGSNGSMAGRSVFYGLVCDEPSEASRHP